MNVPEASPYDVLGISSDASKAAVRDAFARSKRSRAERTAHDTLVDPDSRLEVDAFIVPPPPEAEMPEWTEPDWLSLVDPQPIVERAVQAISVQVARMYLIQVPPGTPMPEWVPKPRSAELSASLRTPSLVGFMRRGTKAAPPQEPAHADAPAPAPTARPESMTVSSAARRPAQAPAPEFNPKWNPVSPPLLSSRKTTQQQRKRKPFWLTVILPVICSAIIFLVALDFLSGEGRLATIVSAPTPTAQGGKVPEVVAPEAGFTAVQSDSTVTLRNISSGSVSVYSWNMGDGTVFETADKNEHTHSYERLGTYTITLTASGPGGRDQSQQTITILAPPPSTVQPPSATPQATAEPTVQPDAPNARFTLDQFGQEVIVRNASTGLADYYNWNMGDGTVFSISNQDDFTHRYEQGGTFNIVLTAVGLGGSTTATLRVITGEPASVTPMATKTPLPPTRTSAPTQTPRPSARTPAPTQTRPATHTIMPSSPTPAAMPFTVISDRTVNIRSCPQTVCAVVDTARPGQVLQITGNLRGDTVSGSDVWRTVRVDSVDAYIHSSLLREGG